MKRDRIVFKLFSITFCAFLTLPSWANQDDARVVLRKPTALFSGSQEGETQFLSASIARGGFGAFVYSDEFHTWKFGLGFDEALVALGDRAIWRVGANFDALADGQSEDFSFRLGQTHYEVFTALELRLDESVFYVGHRHRCRHAADGTHARIVMKTGPEIGFNGLFRFGDFELTTASSALVYLAGQNADLSHQHRLNVSNAVQLEYFAHEHVSIFAGVGLSAIWVSQGKSKEYTIFTEPLNQEIHLSPGAAFGMNLLGSKGDMKFYFGYNSNLDAAFRDKAQQTHIASVNAEFWY